MAPLMTQGAISPFAVSPATKVCVPRLPKGAPAQSLLDKLLKPRTTRIRQRC